MVTLVASDAEGREALVRSVIEGGADEGRALSGSTSQRRRSPVGRALPRARCGRVARSSSTSFVARPNPPASARRRALRRQRHTASSRRWWCVGGDRQSDPASVGSLALGAGAGRAGAALSARDPGVIGIDIKKLGKFNRSAIASPAIAVRTALSWRGRLVCCCIDELPGSPQSGQSERWRAFLSVSLLWLGWSAVSRAARPASPARFVSHIARPIARSAPASSMAGPAPAGQMTASLLLAKPMAFSMALSKSSFTFLRDTLRRRKSAHRNSLNGVMSFANPPARRNSPARLRTDRPSGRPPISAGP